MQKLLLGVNWEQSRLQGATEDRSNDCQVHGIVGIVIDPISVVHIQRAFSIESMGLVALILSCLSSSV